MTFAFQWLVRTLPLTLVVAQAGFSSVDFNKITSSVSLLDQPDSPKISQECKSLVESFQNVEGNFELFFNMYRYSGKDYNDFGRYKSCIKSADKYNYLLLKCKEDRCSNRFPVDVSIGLCVPAQCSIADLQIILPYVLPYLNDHVFPY